GALGGLLRLHERRLGPLLLRHVGDEPTHDGPAARAPTGRGALTDPPHSPVIGPAEAVDEAARVARPQRRLVPLERRAVVLVDELWPLDGGRFRVDEAVGRAAGEGLELGGNEGVAAAAIEVVG